MTRRRRTEILIHAHDLLEELAGIIAARYPVEEIEPANEGMVMIRMRDTARGGPFYLGEVVVTEAKMMVSGAVGLGMIKGHHPEQARQLALVDAAFNAALPEIDHWIPLLTGEEEKIRHRQAGEEARVLRTRVDFTTMKDFDVPRGL